MPMPPDLYTSEIDDMAPRVNWANLLRCPPHFREGPRFISDYQLIYVVSGRGLISIGESCYQATKGDVFFYGPQVRHAFVADASQPYTLIGVHFAFISPTVKPDWPQFRSEPFVEPDPRAQSLARQYAEHTSAPELETAFLRVVDLFERAGPCAGIRLRAALIELLAELRQRDSFARDARADPLSRAVDRAAAWLDAHAADPGGLASVFADCGYNPRYFSRAFRQRKGLSPKEYQMQARLRLACQLLRTTDLPVWAIAVQTGFASPQHFHRVFRRRTGLTPREYRLRSV
ncbi:MAG TPA: AraC family transcriptional regulator [Limnochordia bacterium]